MPQSNTIIWFRRDLRLHDNPAWNWAVQQGRPVTAVYLHSPKEEGTWKRGKASNWWLFHALADLAAQLEKGGHQLVLRQTSNSLQALEQIIGETQARAVCWNRCYEPSFVKRDSEVKEALNRSGIEIQSFNGSLLLDPLQIRNKVGNPFQVFTPFWKHGREIDVSRPETTVAAAAGASVALGSKPPEALRLLPHTPWDGGLKETWNPTRQGGLDLLELAVRKCQDYDTLRDLPAEDGTSRLSPYLHFGQISPREFFHQVRSGTRHQEKADTGILRQLYWREFSAHLLFHFPHSQDTALKHPYDQFPWEFNENHLRAWQLGQTGFPIVDAGMRQLWHTGWMHNRVRMIAGSFLVKHLLQPWQEGARWFWDTLCDADLANNSMGWQWVAGCGADASPYFRVFNPILQGKKFDPDGNYVKQWCPELAGLPPGLVHTPWEAGQADYAPEHAECAKAYPAPVITHEQGRHKALAAYQTFKSTLPAKR